MPDLSQEAQHGERLLSCLPKPYKRWKRTFRLHGAGLSWRLKLKSLLTGDSAGLQSFQSAASLLLI